MFFSGSTHSTRDFSPVFLPRQCVFVFEQEFMRQFLTYGHILTAEEVEAHADEGVPETPPTLTQFKDEVCRVLTIASDAWSDWT